MRSGKALLTFLVSIAALAGCTKKADVKPQPTPTSAAPMDQSMRSSYVVKKGDSLWAISGKKGVLGDSFRWPLLYKSNRDQIEDPDLIEPKEDLSYSKEYSESDVADAVQKAKETPKYSPHSAPRKDMPLKY